MPSSEEPDGRWGKRVESGALGVAHGPVAVRRSRVRNIIRAHLLKVLANDEILNYLPERWG